MSSSLHFLAASDFSPHARHAAERAAWVAGELGATLDLVHALDLDPLSQMRRLGTELPLDLEQRLWQGAQLALQELATSLQPRCGRLPGAEVRAGEVLDVLQQAVAQRPVDVLVLGARGHRMLRDWLLGSTAERMVSSLPGAMLVVKQVPRRAYHTVLVPVDFSAASLPALRLARTIAPQAGVVLLHALDLSYEGKLRLAGVSDQALADHRLAARHEADRHMDALVRAAHLEPHQVRRLVLPGDPGLLVIEQEQEQDSDLIVMGKQGMSALGDWLLGSVTRHALSYAQCDVLVHGAPLLADQQLGGARALAQPDVAS